MGHVITSGYCKRYAQSSSITRVKSLRSKKVNGTRKTGFSWVATWKVLRALQIYFCSDTNVFKIWGPKASVPPPSYASDAKAFKLHVLQAGMTEALRGTGGQIFFEGHFTKTHILQIFAKSKYLQIFTVTQTLLLIHCNWKFFLILTILRNKKRYFDVSL